MIEVINYTKEIKGCKVLNDISVRFESGLVYGLKGRNGSGKTMLMRAICGLISPTQGKVVIDGETLGEHISFPPSVGVLIENPAFIDGVTGYKNLELIASIKGIISAEDIARSLSDVGLDPNDKRKYRKYSLGMKQRLGIAAAIMEKPKLLILDEPLNALDADGIECVHEIIDDFKKRGSTVILSCHDVEELDNLADVIYKMEGGAIKHE